MLALYEHKGMLFGLCWTAEKIQSGTAKTTYALLHPQDPGSSENPLSLIYPHYSLVYPWPTSAQSHRLEWLYEKDGLIGHSQMYFNHLHHYNNAHLIQTPKTPPPDISNNQCTFLDFFSSKINTICRYFTCLYSEQKDFSKAVIRQQYNAFSTLSNYCFYNTPT